MNIAQALKMKNRLAGELAEQYRLLVKHNRHKTEDAEKIPDLEEIDQEINSLIEKLIKIKTAIQIANAENGVPALLARLSEYKTKMGILKSLNTDCGTETVSLGYNGATKDIEYSVYLRETDVIQRVNSLQQNINDLQDQIDKINATTTVDIKL